MLSAPRQQVSLKSRLAAQHISSCTFSLCPADDYTISEAAAVIRTITSRSVFLLTSPETAHSLLSLVGIDTLYVGIAS